MRMVDKEDIKRLFILVALLMSVLPAVAQQVDAAQIEALFSDLNESTPGASVVVTQGEKIIYQNGFGSANLEYSIPVTDQTVFHIASLSKQFTAFAILLLEKEGRLSLDDDIRKYLPYVPDFGETITLKQLATHSSGLRDQWDLLEMSGVRLDDVITQRHVLQLVEHQEALNFSPGERHMYCNTGFTLLAEVVAKVSGMNFAEFTKERIFEPLGMKNTQFYDDHEKIVPNRAYSYKEDNGNFTKSVLSYGTVGPTSLFTTAEDFGAWTINFLSPKVGDESIFAKLNAPTILNNGEETVWASGQFIGAYRNLANYYHSGSDAGYRSYSIRIPEYELSVAVFSNAANFNAGGSCLKIVDIVLDDQLPPREPLNREMVEHDPEKFIQLSTTALKAYVGNYWSDESSYKRDIYLEGDTLMYDMGDGDVRKLLPLDDHHFKMLGSTSDIDVVFSGNDEGEKTMKLTINGDRNINFVAFSKVNLRDYVGNYFSEELQTLYALTVENDTLVLSHRRMEEVKLNPVNENIFLSDNYYLGKLAFVLDEKGKPTGFKANNGRVKNLWFEKR